MLLNDPGITHRLPAWQRAHGPTAEAPQWAEAPVLGSSGYFLTCLSLKTSTLCDEGACVVDREFSQSPQRHPSCIIAVSISHLHVCVRWWRLMQRNCILPHVHTHTN